MTVEPSELGKSPEAGARARSGAARASNTLESGGAAGHGSSGTSPVRWLLVIVPMLVIGAAGANLLGLWTTPSQQAALEEHLKQAERDKQRQAETETPDVGPKVSTTGDPADQHPVKPDEIWPDVWTLLEQLRRQGGEDAGRQPPADTVPGAGQDTAGDAPAEVPAAFDARIVVALLAKADPAKGAAVFKVCRVCHEAAKDAPSKIGPGLWSIVGRPKAFQRGFNYSQALKARGGAWSEEELAEFLHNPRAFVPGTSMAFRGIASHADVANVIAYMRTLSDNPAPLPN